MANQFSLDRSIANYAVFGNPVKHSKSPLIHSLFAKQTGISLIYQAIEVPLTGFNEYVNLFSAQGGLGLNITVPFKEEACAICTTLTDRAALCGSVNTIRFDEQLNIYGETTDGQGFINDLTVNHDINIEGKSVLILGAGGSVKALLEPLCSQKPERIIIANRTISKAEALAAKFSNLGQITAVPYSNLSDLSFDLIINGTSLSLKGKLPDIPASLIKTDTCCYDLMYSDVATVFMQWASGHGASTVMDGLGMLVEQAAESFLFWHGVKPETSFVINAIRQLKR